MLIENMQPDTMYTKVIQAIDEDFGLNEMGNARRVVYYFGDEIRYNFTNDSYHIYDGKTWKPDKSGLIVERVKELPRLIVEEGENSENREKYYKWAAVSCSNYRIRSAIQLAKTDTSITVSQDQFDSDPYLLNINNGILDLREVKLLPHNPKYYLSIISPVRYERDAECPKWIEFLNRIFNENQNVIDFISRMVGYCLTGSIEQQSFFVFWGSGANGKTTFINVIEALLGPYATTSSFYTFMRKRNEQIPNDLARLDGVRFVSASEGEARKRLNESLIKQISGGDKIIARFLHKEFFEFTPQFKVILNTNHKPLIVGQDEAIWRRVKLIPFTVQIPEEERIPDYHKQLIEELPGILNWALKGLEDYYEKGLGFPEEILKATQEYRCEYDIIGDFINDCCTISPQFDCQGSELYKKYKVWCEQNGERPISNKVFGMTLRERGLENFRKGSGNFWKGIGLIDE